MKQTVFFPVIAAALCLIPGCKQEKTIEIPISIQNGYGPFRLSLGGVSPDSGDENNPWKKTYLQVTGIPDEWTDAKKGDIDANIYQTVYQNCLQGNISQEWYEELQKAWDWIPDTLNLSKEPLKCKIAFAFGKDAAGETRMVIDANNNLDFSDDVPFTPPEVDISGSLDDSTASRHLIPVTYERLSNNRIVREDAALFIVYVPSYNLWMCNFSQHARATFKEREFAISSAGFTNLSYRKTELVMMNDSLKDGKKISRDDMISENEYLALFDDEVYKYKGVDMNRNVMLLEKTDLPKNRLYSTQTGFKAVPFEGSDFKSKTSITLDSYKGKYLLIDFWAVWCGPCIQELPNLKTMYDSLDKSKVEIIGIVCESPPDALETMIEQYGITWPQILSDETSAIKQKYNVSGYPTTFLIDPDGVIIAKDLRGKELENKINELIAE
ncbi:MAG: TlpA family protein disulfide reductase [Tannerella sp.]|jgi:peroxiredoxin|nr:TlpA family protein disulfide reductase [Tannerella sp.]